MKLLVAVLTILAASATAQLSGPKNKEDKCGHKCSSHADCPSESACISHKCADPCPGSCGTNSICKVVDHVATCACQSGYTGDPFFKCDPQSSTACPDSWPPVSNGTKTFWVETIKKADWTEAVMFCMQKGQRLASILTRQELHDVKDALENTGIRDNQFWIAGTDHLYEGDWTWFTSNEPITQVTDWKIGEPNSAGDEDCMEFWEGDRNQGYRWNDRPCGEKHYLICEYYE